MWRSAFESVNSTFNINSEIENINKQIQPFYKELHAYIRPRLAAIYGNKNTGVTKDGPLPVHLLSNF